MNLGLRDRSAVVTASSRGLGLAAARALALEGARVVICGRDEGRVTRAAAELRSETGVAILPLALDLEDPAAPGALIERCVAAFGGVDVLVTNVSHPRMGGFDTLSEDDWRSGYETIFSPTLRLIRSALPHMKRQGGGSVINISSHAVKEPGSKYLISAVFRTALASLFKALSREVGPDNIRVNTICPGLIRTPLGEALVEARAAAEQVSVDAALGDLIAPNALPRIGEPEDLGAMVAFLASDAAAHVTGQLWSLDGGKGRGLM